VLVVMPIRYRLSAAAAAAAVVATNSRLVIRMAYQDIELQWPGA
jgi:hypothetical protein